MQKSLKSLIVACSIALAFTLLTLPPNITSNTNGEATIKPMIHGEGA
ncbi:hypothetical protein AR543_p0091 (plasmid) [Paenibacillus bovis]|uniref:Uncharacterized protein n=1 Tax=Paenibacillus bovis TaxID=1616788 RepID=A0A1X9T4A9_9BACL|nr:hypothetical protein AR543_p0091 [Paenibacillus bovis]